MSDVVEPVIEQSTIQQPVGFFQDAPGSNSSGRLVKIVSLVAALTIAFLTMFPFIFGGIVGLFMPVVLPVLSEGYINLVITFFLAFIGLAGGTELVQKLTNK